jgi:lambda family phage portal protein
LEEGEDVKFSSPADVGPNYEGFIYRQLLAVAAGFGVPYSSMTGDMRATSFGSIRAGLIDFRRRIKMLQERVMVFQFARPIWKRFLIEGVISGELKISPTDFTKRQNEFNRAKWIPPRNEWIDPLKDRQAEKLAVDEGWKSRSDVIEAEGGDPEETDARILRDKERAEKLGLEFGEPKPPEIEDKETSDATRSDSK